MGATGETGSAGPAGPPGPAGATVWDSVRDASNGCAAAVGDYTADDTDAIQCHLDHAVGTQGGNVVWLPPGNYLVSNGGLILRDGVELIGAGQGTTQVSVKTDSAVVTFDADSCAYASLRDVTIAGFSSAAATTNAVAIGTNCKVILRDDRIIGGYAALYNLGIDSLIENCFLAGYTAAVTSQGANWYVRDKLDTTGDFPSVYAFLQGDRPDTASSSENHFIQCDFSGDYQFSISIADTTASAITVFDGSVMSSPISITGAKWTSFANDELGSTTFTANSGVVTVTGSYGFVPIAVTGAAVRTGAGNYNVSI